MPKRKMPVKTELVKLDGEYEGWTFTGRTNPKYKTLNLMSSGDFDKIITGLSQVVLDWNFVDEDGEPMGPPSEDTLSDLPADLVITMVRAVNEAITALSGN